MPTTATIVRDAALRCEAKKHAYRQTQDGVVVSFVLHPQEVPEGLATAPLGTRYMMVVVEIGDDEKPVAKISTKETAPTRQQDKSEAGEKRGWSDLSPAQQSGIRCNELAFWRFLNEADFDALGDDEADLIQDAAKAAHYVRLICGVHSRADIGKTQASLAKWRDLDSRYLTWLHHPEFA